MRRPAANRLPWLRTTSILLLMTMSVCMQDVLADVVPNIVVSDRPLHSLVSGILRGIAEPYLINDGDRAPWEHEPDAADRAALQHADIVIWSGVEIEPLLAPLIADLDQRSLLFEALADDALKVLPARHDDRQRDPFYWLDSRNMLILLDRLAELIIAHDPDRAPVYERNWQTMARAIGEVDRALEFGYRDVSGVPVFFYHDTHQYFQQAYAMHVAGSLAPVGRGGGIDAGRMLEMRSLMSETDDTCLFVEQGLDEQHLDLISSGGSVKTVELDSFGVSLPPGPDLYVDLMRNNYRAISACVAASQPGGAGLASDPLAPDVRRFPDRVDPRYLMMDQYGRTVSNEDFRGRLQLINFGYTFCPDVCPTSLAIMGQTMKLLGDDGAQLQPIFITVDPLRDTPEVLKEYVAYFDRRMLGLSASPEVTKRTAEMFRARYEKVPAESGDPRRYTMDHTASLYLLGRNGEFITKFAHGLPAREVAARIRDLMAE